jgi:hypothetical protein
MYQMTRRSRAQASLTSAATPEVRAIRSKLLAEAERKRQFEVAEDEVKRAQIALDRASNLSAETAALQAATARLEVLRSENTTGFNEAASKRRG